MYLTEARGASWSHTTWGRGKRAEEVGLGCYVVEHIATGKFIVGVSNQVSKDVDKLIQLIDSGKYSNKAMLELCARDPDLRLLEYPCMNLKQARQVEKAIRSTVVPKYLLLN